jgi:hypothetical protein
MPGFRGFIVAFIAGLLPAAYFALWFRWPTFLALALGAIVAVVMLMVIASIGPDPAAEEAAWRDAAPDFVRLPGAAGLMERPAVPPIPREARPGEPAPQESAPQESSGDDAG